MCIRDRCKAGVEEKKKFFDFLELNFYIYAKDRKFVISTLDKKYEGLSYNKLQKSGKVNKSYIVIIDVCKNCGNYSIEIEAVSYTHLDVYKRQGLDGGQALQLSLFLDIIQ